VCKQVTVCPGHIWTTLYYSWLHNGGQLVKICNSNHDMQWPIHRTQTVKGKYSFGIYILMTCESWVLKKRYKKYRHQMCLLQPLLGFTWFECCKNYITKSNDTNKTAKSFGNTGIVLPSTVGIILLTEEITRLWVTKTWTEGLTPPWNS
jgi:hypothetical protein